MVFPVQTQGTGMEIINQLSALQSERTQRKAQKAQTAATQAQIPGIKAESDVAVQRAREYATEAAKKRREMKRKAEAKIAEAQGQEAEYAIENEGLVNAARSHELKNTIDETVAFSEKSDRVEWYSNFGAVDTDDPNEMYRDYKFAYEQAPDRIREGMPTPDSLLTPEGEEAFRYMKDSVITALTLGKEGQSRSARTFNIEVPTSEGGWNEVGVQYDAQQGRFFTLDGNEFIPPPGSVIGAKRTEPKKQPSMKEAGEVTWLATTREVLGQAREMLFNEDGSINNEILATSAINVPGFGKGIPGTKGREFRVAIENVVAHALYQRHGTRPRKDQLSDINRQLIPSLTDAINPDIIRNKMAILDSLVSGQLDVLDKETNRVDIPRTIANAKMALRAAKDTQQVKDTVEITTPGGNTIRRRVD